MVFPASQPGSYGANELKAFNSLVEAAKANTAATLAAAVISAGGVISDQGRYGDISAHPLKPESGCTRLARSMEKVLCSRVISCKSFQGKARILRVELR
jgi:hypothetical protein